MAELSSAPCRVFVCLLKKPTILSIRPYWRLYWFFLIRLIRTSLCQIQLLPYDCPYNRQSQLFELTKI